MRQKRIVKLGLPKPPMSAEVLAHWPSGPVPCCMHHAYGLVKLGALMGVQVILTKLINKAQCTNCVSEDKCGKSIIEAREE